MVSNTLNKKVIIRGDKSGVFFGTLVAKEGTEVKLLIFIRHDKMV